MIEEVRIDELIRSKRKTISLTITRDARLVVRAPLRTPLREIEKLVESKRNWIVSKKQQVRERLESLDSYKVETEGQLLFMGRPLVITFTDTLSKVEQIDDRLCIPTKYSEDAKPVIEKWIRQQAKRILTQRTSQLSEMTGIPFRDVRITSARRRWGSCNSINRIQFTWRLIMAESRAIDYVIIHELCHVIHKNHSPAFWSKVGQIMPDYKIQRDWLKQHAYILDALNE